MGYCVASGRNLSQVIVWRLVVIGYGLYSVIFQYFIMSPIVKPQCSLHCALCS